MAFSFANWDKLSAAGNENVRTLWGYTDTSATQGSIIASAFFNNVADIVDVGDLIYVKGSDGSVTVMVSATDPNVTVTSNPDLAPASIVNADIAPDALIDYSKIAASNILQSSSTTVTAAQFKGAYAAPVLLLPPPGAGIAYFVEAVVINMIYTAPAYANGDDIVVLYGAITGNPAASEAITAANFYATADSVFSAKAADLNATVAAVANQGLYLTNDTGAFTAGNSSFTVTVWYRQLLVS